MEPDIKQFLKKIFSLEIQRLSLLENENYKINNFVNYFKSTGKKILCELAIDYFKDLYQNTRDQNTISMARYVTTSRKIIHNEIKNYAEINIVETDLTLDNNNWYFLPYDKKLGEKFLTNSWSQEDIIFTSAPEIPHLIFVYASHISKFLEESEVITFENISSVASLDSELTLSPELNVDPNYKWRKKISRNDTQNNQFNLVLTSIIKLKKSRPYKKDEVRYQFFKIYAAILAIKEKGATEIHFGGKYLNEYIGKKRAIICIFYFAASLAGINKVHFYTTDGFLDRADEAIQKYAEHPLNEIITMLSDDCYSTSLIEPNKNASWQWYQEKSGQWKNYVPYLSSSFEEESIGNHSVEYPTEHGAHIVDFDNMTDMEASRNTVVKIRRIISDF